MADRMISDVLAKPDAALEMTLRPSLFSEFTGQANVKERLEIAVQAAKKRGEALDHLLFSGPPGLGKTTLAHIIAKSMGANIKCTSGPTIEKAGDLAGLLTNLEAGDVLFIDEIHRLQKTIEEYLYPAMEDFKLDIIIDQRPQRPQRPPESAALHPHWRDHAQRAADRAAAHPLSHSRAARLLPRRAAPENRRRARPTCWRWRLIRKGRMEIARRSRGTPRISNNLLRRVRDYAQVRGDGTITVPVADQALAMLAIDQNGLDEMDKRILETIVHKFAGGPVGLGSLAVAVGEEPDTLEEVYEPFLIMEGYLNRTSQGRVATELSYKKLGIKPGSGSQSRLL